MRRSIVIMAGGAGKRFWPLSRKARPKQLLSLVDPGRSLLGRTFDRARTIVDPEDIWVVTGAAYAEDVQRELGLHIDNILVEPVGRNTAPCIAWATREILERKGTATIAVLPSDHHIADEVSFRTHLELAMTRAEASERSIVLLGIVPTYAETGYGYIRAGETVPGTLVRRVAAFVEKPDRATAERYLADGSYYWNAGLFVFDAARMMLELQTHLPELVERLVDVQGSRPSRTAFEKLPNISIDYGVMERAKDLLVVPSSFGWSDVGSFDALFEVLPKGEGANVLLGDAVAVDTTGTLIDARGGRVVAVVGMDGVSVIDTKDAVLVVKRGRSQDVQKAVARLEGAGRTELL